MAETTGSLTRGSITRVLTRLSMPIVAAAFLSTAYSITDMAWVGLLGGEVLAGVGIGSMYIWLSQGVAALPKMGGQVLAAQEIGRGNQVLAECYASTAIRLAVLSGIIFGIICLVFTDPLIAFFGLESPQAIEAARIYIKITCGLVVFSFMGLVLTGLYTAQGDSNMPLKANFIGLVINMLLDPLMILGVGPFPKMGTTGAAVATVTAQVIAMLVMLSGIVHYKREYNVLKNVKLFGKVDHEYTRQVIMIGGPSAVQSMVYCMISMVLSKLAGRFGDAAIAVLRVGGQVESISWNIVNGFSAAMNAFSAQNYGAGRMDRVRKGYKVSMITVVIWGALVSVVFILFPREISGIFFHDPDEIRLLSHYLIIVGLGEAFMSLELMSVGAISGLGNTKLCSIISITFTAIRIPIAIVLCGTALGADGLWWAITISGIMKGIIFYVAFYQECRRK